MPMMKRASRTSFSEDASDFQRKQFLFVEVLAEHKEKKTGLEARMEKIENQKT